MFLGIRWQGLRAKIVAWSFVPAAIILAAVALVGFQAYQRVTQDLVVERNREVARLSAGGLASELAEYSGDLTELAQTAEIFGSSLAVQRRALREARNRLVVFDAGVVLLDNQGRVVASEPERQEIQGQNWSDRGYFRDTVRTRAPVFSDIVGDGPGRASVVAVAVPVVNAEGALRGVLTGMFRLGATTISSFYGSIVKLRLGGDDVAYLVDRDGRVIYHADANRIGEDFSTQAAVQQVLGGQGGALRTRDPTGQEIVASFAPVPETPWALVIEARWDALMRAGQGYRRFLLLLLGLGLLIPAVVVAIGVRRITRPINELIQGAKEVAGGNFGQTIVPTTGGELAELITQFNTMSAQLADSYSALQAREERLQLVMQATNDGIWDWDLRTDDVYYSPRWKEMLGYAEHELANRFEEWRSLVHPDDLERAQARVQAELAGETPVYELEHRLRHKDGSYRWILARGISLRDAEGKPYRMVGSHTDITARKEAETAVQQRLAFERLITDISTEFINLRPNEIEAGIRRALQAVGQFTGDDRSYVFQFSADGTVMDNTHEWCAPGVEPFMDRLQGIPAHTFPWLMDTLRRFDEVYIPRVADLPAQASAERAEFESQGIQSILIMPMAYRGFLAGFVGFDAVRAEKQWPEDSIALLKIVGEIFVNALEHKRAQEALQSAYQELEQRVAERTHELATLNAIAGVVSRSLDLEEILGDALERTLEAMGMDLGVTYRLKGDGSGPSETLLLQAIAHQGISDDLARTVDPLPLRGSFAEKAATSGQPIPWRAADYPAVPLREAMLQEQIQAGISVPLMAKGKLVGAMVLAARQDRPLTPEEVSLLASIGQQVGVAMENARLYEAERARHEESERRRQVAETLREILTVLNSRQSLPETLDFIVSKACRVLNSDGASLLRLEDEGSLLRIQAACGLEEDHVANMSVPSGTGAAGQALAARQPVAVADTWEAAWLVQAQDPLPEPQRALLTGLVRRYRALLSVPLVVRDEDYGAITLYYRDPRDFSDEEIRLAMSVADQAALAIESARLREQAEQAAAVAERSRLARELHDSVTQNLYSVTLYAEAAARCLTGGEQAQAVEHLRELRDTAQEALREMRLLIFELRPLALEKSGLLAALQARLDAVEIRSGTQAELGVEGEEYAERLPRAVQHELYHIIQEALNNVLKHARAQHVWVTLQFRPDLTRLEVRDDGVGFDPSGADERGGLGLRGVQERAVRLGAELRIDSAPGEGTRVMATMPAKRSTPES